MQFILEKSYDGRAFKVKAEDGIQLDAMFFPFN